MKSTSIAVGSIFGRWQVVGTLVRKKLGEGRGANYPVYYPCRCECGTERLVRAFKLLGNSTSCGCFKQEQRLARVVHGMNRRNNRHPLYNTWSGMCNRCNNPSNSQFQNYGGRGISVEWTSFQDFASWAHGAGWVHGLEIDRIDNNGPYAAWNCRIVTGAENKRNKRTNKAITAFGETKCITDWALDDRCNVTPSSIKWRMAHGMTAEEAISAPRKTRHDSRSFEAAHKARAASITKHPL
jgi:hypothetical protein